MKGITCSGEVAWAGESKNIVGTTGGGKDYDFWSQFIVIKDDTDKIGVSITLEEGQPSISKGDIVTIEKAELQEYLNKDKEPTLKLQGKLQGDPPQAQQGTQEPRQATKALQGRGGNSLNREQVKSDVICAIIASRHIPESKEIEKWVNVIMTNQSAQNSPIKAQFCDKCRNLKEECSCEPY
jgi:hypothetical protein